ncbi:MAG: phosphatidylserine synthase [Ruminococcaceae bacterium]|nr:phosphatidylserine synthase [Oscillospiraceae bacterium]
MIGVYDYTVILTYLSLLSAGSGIILSLSGGGHPYLGVFCLLLCGFLDAFDGRVARRKKNRTELEKNFGIQIDSLSDLVAFGVLPACIGAAFLRHSRLLNEIGFFETLFPRLLCYAFLVLYVLAAMIRLAYYNVTEEERQKTEDGARKYFVGVPVTSAALTFPTVLLVDYVLPTDISLVYVAVALLSTFAFVSKIQIPKPGARGVLIMVGIGLAEGILLILALSMKFGWFR